MAIPKIILCTGANQGLGFSTLKIGGLRDQESTYILGSRDEQRGKEAAATLREAGVTATVDVVKLDVTNDDEIIAAVAHVEQKYGRLDVLINNAGILRRPASGEPLSQIRATYNELLNLHISSSAVVTEAFTPLLRKSKDPKVISVSSGLGSCANSLTKVMGRAPAYGASKIGLNGLMVHLQVAENDRVAAEEAEKEKEKGAQPQPAADKLPRIRYYVIAPGALNTNFSGFLSRLRHPDRGAEVIVHLMADDDKTYEGGSYWEYEDDEMRQVPW